MKKYLHISLAMIFMFIAGKAISQHDPYSGPQWRGSKNKHKDADSTSLLYAFRQGEFHGHFRNFFMSTINEKDLSDYYANAIGGGLRYETAPFKGFQFAVSGYFTHNLFSSDLAAKDSTTGASNRYEVGLFDIEDPENKHDLDRLEELYLRYNFGKNRITLGKQILRSPFINPQDGRMRPTEIDGIYGEFNPSTKLNINGGWFYKISPRSTIEWYSIGHSIGIYPQGLTPEGKPSDYKESLKSAGIFLLQGSYRINQNVNIRFLEQYTDNIFNTAWAQIDFEKKHQKGKVLASVQFTRQDPIAQGGNSDPAKTYFAPGTYSNIVSARLGWIEGNWQTSVNYTRISKGGRFLSPREWGRDPFFTFLPRERNEGLGDVHAIMAKATRKVPKANLVFDLGIGYYDLPDVRDFAHNKYGMPSYVQTNAELKYEFQGILHGLDLDILYVYKANAGETYNEPRYMINKVNMSNINVVLNYHF
ncbi:MAG: OprD family outer membrane porin [Chitinophagaceae bacterium]|nr:OprD family outer membrane porin [Chitinophagaceae bacterium]